MEKDKKNKKKKIIIIALTSLIGVFAITISTLLTCYVVLHKDDARNPYTSKDLTNEEILNKCFIEGFKNTKDFGKYTYIISDDDLQQLVHNGFNSTKEKLPKKVENITFETNGTKQIYHIDLSLPIIKSRINIETELKYFDKLEKYGYSINYMQTGKLDVYSNLVNGGALTNELCDLFFTNSCLPFKAKLEQRMLEINYTNLINKMPSNEMINLIKDFMLNHQEYMGFSSDFIGFQIDFTNMRSDTFNTKNKSVVSPINLYEKVQESFTENKLNQITPGETSSLCKISIEELNANFTSSLRTNLIEEKYTSNLTNQIVSIRLDKILLSLINANSIRIDSFISINGFLVDLSFNADLTETSNPNNFVIGLKYNEKEGINLGNDNVVANNLVKHIVINSIASLNFCSYSAPTKTLRINFKSIIDNSIIIGLNAYNFNLYFYSDGLDFTATRL